MSRVVIVSGPPGAGKSTVARGLSLAAPGPLAMHMHTDDFYGYVRKGFVPPWLPEAKAQRLVLSEAMAKAAATCASAGYEVYVDGVVRPGMLPTWLAVARAHGLDLRYVVLFPAEAETVSRARGRQGPNAMRDAELARRVWGFFKNDPPPPGHSLDTTEQTPVQTIALVQEGLALGRFSIS